MHAEYRHGVSYMRREPSTVGRGRAHDQAMAVWQDWVACSQIGEQSAHRMRSEVQALCLSLTWIQAHGQLDCK